MSLVEHIQELRRRLIISLIALFIGTVVGYIWYQRSLWGIPTLGDILRGPYCSLPPEKRASFSPDGECRLLATRPFEMFMLRLKVGALAGTVFSSPVWLGQLWRFITPGLLKNERRYTFSFVFVAVVLFITGAVVAYYVIAYGLEFLFSVGHDVQVAAMTGHDYYGFLLASLLIFGVSFEVPLFLATLNLVGVLHYDSLKDKRRLIVMLVFVFAAVATPGQDPVGMTVLGLALCLLVELALQFTRINDKRRKNSRPEWMDVGDDQASGSVRSSGALGSGSFAGAASGPVRSSGPVRPSPRPRSGSTGKAARRPAPGPRPTGESHRGAAGSPGAWAQLDDIT